ncbi:MAG: RHS repeat-associated core domain-containing protein, partial [Arenicella sp.]
YEYNELGDVTKVTDSNGHSSVIEYDAASRVKRVSRDNGPSIEVAFDDESRVINRRLFNAQGGVLDTVSYLYDAQNRLSQSNREQAKQSSHYRYDANGGLVQVVDQDDKVTDLSQSSLGQLLQISQPGEVSTILHLDGKGQAVGLTDSNGNTTIKAKDDFGRVVRLVSADTGTQYYNYDLAGNVTQKRAANDELLERQYDAANRIVEQKSSDDTIRYQYDEASGRLATVENGTSQEFFLYDAESRLVSHRRVLDDNEFVTEYRYNDLGQLAQKILPDGQVLNHHYYAEGANQGALRAITRDDWFGLNQTELLTELDDNQWDGETQINFGNGLSTTRRYDDNGKLASIDTGSTLKLGYDYDNKGNIVGLKTNDDQATYVYDDYNRLTGADFELGSYRYEYDKTGNRTQKTETGKRTQGQSKTASLVYAGFGQGNRLESVDGQKVEYNAAGSPTSQPSKIGVRSYDYNAEQRPTKLYVDGELRAEYRYNGFGERVKKVVYSQGTTKGRGKVTYYLYDGHSLSAEVDGSGDINSQYVYHRQQPVVKLEGKTPYYIHVDHLGTPRMVTDAKQNIAWQAQYTPFGSAEVVKQEIELNLRFPGQYEDKESGTYYNYFRDYDPEIGRYLTSDPIGLKGGINTYAYVGADPIGGIDPLGLFTTPSSDAESDALIEQLSNASQEEIATYVNNELSSFDDRQHFYLWAHEQFDRKPDATHTDWFLAASQVNEFDALGGVGFGGGFLDPFMQETEDFLVHAGLELANHNINTFVVMIGGGSVFNMCFLSQEAQDLQMVVYEQERLGTITNQYFADHPELNRDEIMTDINDVFNQRGVGGATATLFGDADIRRIINKHFHDKEPPIDFDINNIEHRIILGQELVRINAGTYEE